MSTQRRENRWRRTSCTKHSEASGSFSPRPVARCACSNASGGTAPPGLLAWLATNSLQLDHRTTQLVRFVRIVHHDIRHSSRSSPPPGAGSRAATGTPATRRSSLPHIPFPPGFARLHPTLPQIPAGQCRWTERYDGKRDLHLQHAA